MAPALFSTVGEVLVVVAQAPDSRVRDIAEKLGVTERTVIHAVRVLEDSRIITVVRDGRRNRYAVVSDATVQVGGTKVSVSRLLEVIGPSSASAAPAAVRKRNSVRAH